MACVFCQTASAFALGAIAFDRHISIRAFVLMN